MRGNSSSRTAFLNKEEFTRLHQILSNLYYEQRAIGIIHFYMLGSPRDHKITATAATKAKAIDTPNTLAPFSTWTCMVSAGG